MPTGTAFYPEGFFYFLSSVFSPAPFHAFMEYWPNYRFFDMRVLFNTLTQGEVNP